MGRDRGALGPTPRVAIEGAAQVYVEADRVTAFYGMGLTQQVHGFENVAMLVNMLLLPVNHQPSWRLRLAEAMPHSWEREPELEADLFK